MSKKRTTVRSTGPVKGISTAGQPGKKVKPAWTGMLKPPTSDVLPSKSLQMYEDFDDSEEDEGDGLAYHRNNIASRESHNGLQNTRNRNKGFSLQESMNALNVSHNSNTVDDFFAPQASVNFSSPQKTLAATPNRRHQSKRKRHGAGPFEPQVSPEFEKMIISGEFIDFPELVILLGHRKTVEDAFALLVKDILVWLDCFMFYTSVIGTVSPGRISGLMRYSRTIMWIYKESQDVSAWWKYDKAYRRMAAVKGLLKKTTFFNQIKVFFHNIHHC